ncbi:MAG: DUF2924 domain-containing protein [Pseudomonadota bacterium]
MSNETLAKITTLRTMPMGQIKKMWKDLYQTEAPEFNRTYLVSRLSYRLQELAWGGETEALEKRIAALAREKLSKNPAIDRKKLIRRPPVGTRLIREYLGAQYQVMVLADGFAFQGRKYRSLSRIAQIITGSSWSGPAFFGMKEPKGAA